MIRLTKYLLIAGIPAIIVLVLALSWMYRWVAFNDIQHHSEKSNLILTRAMANAIWPQISGLVLSTNRGNSQQFADDNAINTQSLKMIHILLEEPINELVEGTNVVRVKLFNIEGLTLFSSASEQVGIRKSQSYEPIANARKGLVTTHLDHRDVFFTNRGEQRHDRYILTSYLPVRSTETGNIEAVFEIYSDVTVIFAAINASQLKFALALTVVFAVIYVVVYFILRHLGKVIKRNIELVVARDTAKDASKAKSQFLANMSHELRTPLNAVIGYSELIEEDLASKAELSALPDLQKIQSAAHHLLNLINEILDLSKIEAGQMTLFYEAVPIRELIDEVVAVVMPSIIEQDSSFSLSLDPSLDVVRTDVLKMRQILLNLLSNASKFTTGGRIDLTIQITAEGVVYSVTDTGIGLTSEQIGQLFQPFVQADTSSTRRYGGTGLGLVISKQFCEMLGGHISVSSVLGSGSVFNVILPGQAVDAQQDAPAAKRSAA